MNSEKNTSNEDELKNIRFFRVNEDVNFGMPLKKGDIVRIPNSFISMYVIDPLFPNCNIDSVLGEYPKDQSVSPKGIVEFLKKKKIHCDRFIEPFYLEFGTPYGVYLTKDLALKIFADTYHEVELDMYASSSGASSLFPGIPDYIAKDKFDEAISQSDGLSFPMYLGDYNRMRVLNTAGSIKQVSTDGTSSPLIMGDNAKKTALSFVRNTIEPGIYNTDETVTVKFYMNEDESIDFGEQPEFLYNYINHHFLQFIENSTEITNESEKKEIYANINKDTITTIYESDKIRYYRIKPGISINADQFHVIYNDTLETEGLSITGFDGFNPTRIAGKIQIVERNSDGEPKIIKVVINEGSEANWTYITDNELSKITERLSGAELSMTRIKDINLHKRKKLEQLKERYRFANKSSTDYEKDMSDATMGYLNRLFKLIDIAAIRLTKMNISDAFKQRANEYFKQNTTDKNGNYRTSKSLNLFKEIYFIVSGNIDLDEQEFGECFDYLFDISQSESFILTFYMVHLIEKSTRNPELNREHKSTQIDNQAQFTRVLNKILKKKEEQEK